MTTIDSHRSTSEKRILSLQLVTLAWMLVECSAGLTAAWTARSVSLLAFGSDSLVELISAVVVLLQFTPQLRISQMKAARFCGTLLLCLAAVISMVALYGLFNHLEADTSLLGIAITGAALVLMPGLARMKRNTAEQTRNRALRADAVQSATCAYLAAVTMGGLLFRWAFGIHWLDQAAALITGFRKHRRAAILFLMLGGLSCICGTAWFGDSVPSHNVEVAITFVGSGSMIAAHRLNHTFCRSCKCSKIASDR